MENFTLYKSPEPPSWSPGRAALSVSLTSLHHTVTALPSPEANSRHKIISSLNTSISECKRQHCFHKVKLPHQLHAVNIL